MCEKQEFEEIEHFLMNLKNKMKMDLNRDALIYTILFAKYIDNPANMNHNDYSRTFCIEVVMQDQMKTMALVVTTMISRYDMVVSAKQQLLVAL